MSVGSRRKSWSSCRRRAHYCLIIDDFPSWCPSSDLLPSLHHLLQEYRSSVSLWSLSFQEFCFTLSIWSSDLSPPEDRKLEKWLAFKCTKSSHPWMFWKDRECFQTSLFFWNYGDWNLICTLRTVFSCFPEAHLPFDFGHTCGRRRAYMAGIWGHAECFDILGTSAHYKASRTLLMTSGFFPSLHSLHICRRGSRLLPWFASRRWRQWDLLYHQNQVPLSIIFVLFHSSSEDADLLVLQSAPVGISLHQMRHLKLFLNHLTFQHFCPYHSSSNS